MANTVSNISYANTFGDWVVATDALIRENNTLGKSNYTKDSGTLTLSESSLVALQSSGDIVAQKQLLVQGLGSSATIDNNLTVGKQVYFTNAVLGLTHTGQANMNGLIVAQGPNIGITVANNAYVGGNTTIRYNTVTDKLQANTSVTTSNVSSDTITNSGLIYTNQVAANTLITSATLNNSGFVYTNILSANTSVVTPTVTSTTINNSGTITSNTVVAANVQATSSFIETLTSNTVLNVTRKLDANSATGFFSDVYAQNIIVSNNFVLSGSTIYASNTFLISQNVAFAIDSFYNVDRGPGQTQASFRWTESPKNWQIRNVTSGTYYRVLTDEYLTNSLTDTSTTNIASANAANALNNSITTTSIYGQASYSQANAATIIGQFGNVQANNAYNQANTATIIGQFGNVQANNAYNQANTALTTALAVKTSYTGTTGSTFSSNSITFTSNNGITIAPVGSNTFAISTSQDIRTSASPSFSTLTLTGTPLGTGSGGTGVTSPGAAFGVFVAAAAGTGTSGQVLTTGGAGSYYWSTAGSGSSVQPGTTISSSRLTYSGDNANTVYTTPAFSQPNQLRAYINGIRQFQSEYTANSTANTITFTTPPSIGDSILIEVDGYIINPYYANNIPVSPTGTITGNTIQLAINSLESSKAALAGATFTGQVIGLTHDANTSNTSFATTQYVKNVLNQTSAISGLTYSISTSGNAGTVTNGVYTNGSYENPSWITSLANTKISGLVSSATTDTTNATNISSGTLSVLRLPFYSNQGVGTANNVQFNSLGVGTAGSATAGEIRATNNITAYYSSDKKFKENVQDIPNALEKVTHIGGKLFDWTDDYIKEHGGEDGYFVQKSDFGVIAQNVLEVFPLATRTRPSDGSLAVDYSRLCALAFAAIKELKQEIDILKNNKQ